MSKPVNLHMSIAHGDLAVYFDAEGVTGYAPDVAHDLTTQALRAFTEAITELRSHGILGIHEDADIDEDEDDEATADDTE